MSSDGHPPVRFYDFPSARQNFLADVLAGLSKPQKQIPAKYFYDRRGCELFAAICELPEYYLTRTETAMMHLFAAQMAQLLGSGCQLIEYGSGASRKTRILLEHLRPPAYLPIDVACEELRASSRMLAREFPGMQIIAVCADFSEAVQLPDSSAPELKRKAIYFSGSTIGNFTKAETVILLKHAAQVVSAQGAMLVGVDLKKPQARLVAAYNDGKGVTAEFNLNLLARINRELNGNFRLEKFCHRAFYNAEEGRIEMHLESLTAQQVMIGGRCFDFRAGETIHTENSYKYSLREFQQLARQAGFDPLRAWTDEEHLFSVHYLCAGG
ncbi:MAG TPA: L-histidine N(alpha)-methyltransferase [Burkholderiales bacterium]|nr:L-histidine N(alpha)-methyltransferase [Burkholderiales bacterium]